MYEYHYHKDDVDDEIINDNKNNEIEETNIQKTEIQMPENTPLKEDKEKDFCGPVKYECSKCKFMCANQNILLEHCKNIHNKK